MPPASNEAEKWAGFERWRQNLRETFADRFWARVDKSGECWLWTGAITARGYGLVTRDRKYLGTHRVAWELSNNATIPEGRYICHTCDNPACVRPSHLFLGDPLSNMQDKVAKGRHHAGSRTLIVDGMKFCKGCGEIKLISEFSPAGRSQTGTRVYHPICKICRNERNAEKRRLAGAKQRRRRSPPSPP